MARDESLPSATRGAVLDLAWRRDTWTFLLASPVVAGAPQRVRSRMSSWRCAGRPLEVHP